MKPKMPPERQLRILAREFRGTKDEQKRTSIAKQYARLVAHLINSKRWRRIPVLEDQLPDAWMPDRFFEYWRLRLPIRRAGRTG
jgi:hypothetical protein